MMTLLILDLPVELDDDLIDYLMSMDTVANFSSYAVSGHGEGGKMSVAEQVSGRRRRVRFEVILPQHGVEPLLEGLAENVGRDIVWWQMALAGSGRI